MKLFNKCLATILIATTITQAYGMSKLTRALTRTRISLATSFASMKSAAAKSAFARFAPKVARTTSASSAKVIASRLWQNKGNRLALSAMATAGAISAPSAKAEKQEKGYVSKGNPHDFYCKTGNCAPILFPDKFNPLAWDTVAPSLAAQEQPANTKPDFLTVAHLKREAALTYQDYSLGERYFRVAPSSLKTALNNLTTEQEEALNKYHQAVVEKASAETRAQLWHNVSSLVRNEEQRTEILDNLRWLQKSNNIGRTVKGMTESSYGAAATTAVGVAGGIFINPCMYALALLFPLAYASDISKGNHTRNHNLKNAGHLSSTGEFIPVQ